MQNSNTLKPLKSEPLFTDMAILFFRMIYGGMFVYYGYSKLISFNEILPMFTDYIGIGSKLSLILVIFAELFCGLFIVVGFMTRLAIIPVIITMIVAYFIAHAADPFQAKQLAFIYLLLAFVVLLLGSGKYSFDKLILKL